MPNLPQEYAWLTSPELQPLPKMVAEALNLFGVAETLGPGNTPEILAWAAETGLRADYNADEIPWCGLFMAVVAKRAGKVVPDKPLWALNWGKFGQDGGQPELGDVLTFIRPTGGHVGLYVGEDAATYHVLGGNQKDRVCIIQLEKTRLRAVRQPPYSVKPASARPFRLKDSGARSTNEQ